MAPFVYIAITTIDAFLNGSGFLGENKGGVSSALFVIGAFIMNYWQITLAAFILVIVSAVNIFKRDKKVQAANKNRFNG